MLSCLLTTCLERADLLVFMCVVFYCFIVTFPYGIPGQVWYLIVSIADLCLPFYFYKHVVPFLILYSVDPNQTLILAMGPIKQVSSRRSHPTTKPVTDYETIGSIELYE